jgi:hypothetical protein
MLFGLGEVGSVGEGFPLSDQPTVLRITCSALTMEGRARFDNLEIAGVGKIAISLFFGLVCYGILLVFHVIFLFLNFFAVLRADCRCL